MCTGKNSTIYCSSVGQEKNDRLVTGHTSVDGRDVQWKNQHMNLFLLRDSGFTEEAKNNNYDDDDTKIPKSRVSKFSRGELQGTYEVLRCMYS